MTLDEVVSYGTGTGEMISDELYATRKEAYGVYFEGDTFVEVEGKEAVEKIIQQEGLQKFLEKQTQSAVTELKGRVAFKGYAKGKVRLVFNQKDADLVEEGDILISPMTQVEFLSGLRRCGAIVTDEGGIVCHAAIVAREFGKPCVLATKNATQMFKTGDLVEVDADNGVVWIIVKE
jgi:pyruvate,water dikinase